MAFPIAVWTIPFWLLPGKLVSRSYFTRLIRLSYLAPDITQAILDGHQPRGLTQTRCRRTRVCPWPGTDHRGWSNARNDLRVRRQRRKRWLS
jgi:hypothetical protein